MLPQIADKVTQHRKDLETRKAQKGLLLQQKATEIQKLAEAERKLNVYDQVNILLQKTSDFARNTVKSRIETVVTQALTVIFGQAYTFTIDIVERAGRPECDYYLNDGDVITKLEKPDYSRGGGIVDGVSLALLLALGELTGNSGPLFLDEVGKHISAEYAENVAYFLKEYSYKFNRQIVLVTHNVVLGQAGDVSVSVRKVKGDSEVLQ